MSGLGPSRRRVAPLLAVALLTACGDDDDDLVLGAQPGDAGVEADPLALPGEVFPPDSFDALQAELFAPRCAGTPGLCHNGQFEPNLATPAVSWASLVRRPSREQPSEIRVEPGAPEESFLVRKLRGTAGSSQMPLGAEPLAEADLVRIEDWIRDGARRTPGDEPPEAINEPPSPGEIGIFDLAGNRLDSPPFGPATAEVGQTLVFRMSARDLETPDSEIPFALFSIRVRDGAYLFNPELPMDGELALATLDDGADLPEAADGEPMNFSFIFVVPEDGTLQTPRGRESVRFAGTTFDVLGVYFDALPEAGGLPVLTILPQYLRVSE